MALPVKLTKSKEAFWLNMWNQKPCFRFEIDNFSEKKAAIKSKLFVSGGYEWYLKIHPKGDNLCDDRLSLYLCVANPKSLGRGWERSVNHYFVLLNQSDKELYKSPIGKKRTVFCAKNPGWGFRKTLPLSKFQEKGFLENDRLVIEVYIKTFVEAFEGEGGVVSKTKETTTDINGFQVLASLVTPVRKIFAEHPDLAEDFKPKNQLVDYVKSMIDEFHSRKRADADGSRVQQLEERVKNLELMDLGFKVDCLKSKLEDVYLEMKKSDDDGGSRVQQLEECVKNLKMLVSDLKVELDKEKAKSCCVDGFLLVDEVA